MGGGILCNRRRNFFYTKAYPQIFLTDNFGILVLLSLPIFDQWGTLLAFILWRIKSKSNPKMSCPYNKEILAWQNQFLKVHVFEIHIQVFHIKVHYSNLKKNRTKGSKCTCITCKRYLLQWHLDLIYESWPKGIPLRLFHWEAFQPVISFPSNIERKAFKKKTQQKQQNLIL